MSLNNRRRNFRSRSPKNNFRRRSNSININNTSSLTSNGNVNFNRNGSMNNLHALEKTMQKFPALKNKLDAMESRIKKLEKKK